MRLNDLIDNGFKSYAIYQNHKIKKIGLFKKIKFITNLNENYFGKYKTIICFKVKPNIEMINYAKTNKINLLYSDLFLNDFSLILLDICNNSILNNANFLDVKIKIADDYCNFMIIDDLIMKKNKVKINIKDYHGLGIPLFYVMCKKNNGKLKINFKSKIKYQGKFNIKNVVYNDLIKTIYILFNSPIEFNFSFKNQKNDVSLNKFDLIKKFNNLSNLTFFNWLEENIKI